MELSLLGGVVTANGMAHNRVLETVPRQTADWTGELVLKILWSYVEGECLMLDYILRGGGGG